MEDYERHAVLLLDEMQLASGLAYDQGTGGVIGKPTIPLSDGTLPEDAMATHGLVFMLAGVTTRWKQTVAYHFTSNSFCSATVKAVVIDIIKKCEDIGIKIDAVVCDMGGGNQALWKEFGIVVGRYCHNKVSCCHPCDNSRQLYFMADVAHLLKNLRNHLTRGQSIFLPEDLVGKLGLSSNEVSLVHVKKLLELDSKLELNIAPHLKPSCLDPGHYEKMKVGLAFSLFNHDTAAALRLLVQKEALSEDALTTAWFFETVFKWFKIMTSRTTKLAISKFDDAKYVETISFMKDVMSLFSKIKIGVGKQFWKPVQTGVILVTTVALELQDYYLNKKGYVCVLLSRFGQDALENLFSTLRSKNPVPRPLEFRCAIRAATMAQFFRPSKSGSYDHDTGYSLIGLSSLPARQKQNVDPTNIAFPDDVLALSSLEQESFEYLAGYAVNNVQKNMSTCSECRKAVTCKDANTLTQLKSYTEKIRLALPSPAVVQFLESAENLFRVNSAQLVQNELTLSQLEECVLQSVTHVNCFPDCHNIANKLLKVYLKTRLQIHLRKENQRLAEIKSTVKCGSRSIGKQVATSNVK